MRDLLTVGTLCLVLLVPGCGSGGGGETETGKTVGNERQTVRTVQAQVESRCPTDSQSDFCVQAYKIIAQWTTGQITNEEFVGRIAALMEEESSLTDANQRSGIEETPEPIAINAERRCGILDSLLDEAYDPAWEDQVNARQRRVYTGTGGISIILEGENNSPVVVENIRIYSYNPDGQSLENTKRVLEKLMCRLSLDPDFHKVVLRHGQRNEDGERIATLGFTGRPEGNVLLFFTEDEVSSLIDVYDEMTYSEIRRDVIINEDYDYLGYSKIHDYYPADGSLPNSDLFSDFGSIAGFYFGYCESLRDSRFYGCVPNATPSGGLTTALGKNVYYDYWFLIWNNNLPEEFRRVPAQPVGFASYTEGETQVKELGSNLAEQPFVL